MEIGHRVRHSCKARRLHLFSRTAFFSHDQDGSAMKRFFMLVAVVILSASWASPAQAQLGIGGFGGMTEPPNKTEAAKSQTKLRKQESTKAQPKAGRAQATRPSKSAYNYNYNSLDRFGRV